MATYNPIAPDAIYGELQPEAMTTGMKGEYFGPDVEGLSGFERDRLIDDFQRNTLPMQQALAQARAGQDKQAMDLQKFRMFQDSHRMSMRSSDIAFEKSKLDLGKSIRDAQQEADIAMRMPIVLGQLDAIDRDPKLNNFQRASAAARLQGQYAAYIAKSPALGNLFNAYQSSNQARRAGETQEFERGFRFSQLGVDPDTTLPEFAEGVRTKKEASQEKEGRENQIKYLTDEWSYFDDLEKRLNDLDTTYHPADPATGYTAVASGQYGGDAPKVDRTMPKVYTPQATESAIFIAQRIGESSGMTQPQIEEFVKKATNMPSFIPLLRKGLDDLRRRNLDQKGVLYGYDSTGERNKSNIGSWGSPAPTKD